MIHKQMSRKILLLMVGLVGLGLFALYQKPVYAAIPGTINFQGKIVDNTSGNQGINIPNNSYSIVFRIYYNVNPATYDPNAISLCSSDTNCYWEETQASVTVTNGVFQVELGSVCAFSGACNSGGRIIDFNAANGYYLTMKFAGDSQYMKPLVHLQSVPFAFNSDKLGGITSSGFVQLSPGSQQTGNINFNGNYTEKFSAGNNFTVQNASGNNALVFDESTKHLNIYENIATPANYLSLYYDNATSSGIITVNSGTLKVGPGSGPISMVAGASSAVTITGNAASTWSTSTGLLTIQGGTGVSLSGNGSNITIGDTSAGTTIVQSSSGLALGVASSKDGILKFNTSAGANSVSLQLAANPGSSYALLLPTTGPSTGQCLQTDSSTANQLKFGSCAGGSTTLQNAYDASGTPATITTTAAKGVQISSGAAPTDDLLTIDNTSYPNVTNNINGVTVNYAGGNTAVEAAGIKVNFTPGGQTSGTWSGIRIVANTTGAVSGVTEYGLKLEGPTSPGAGTEKAVYIGTGWDIGLDIQSGGLQLLAQSDPATPAANNLRIYAKSIAGRIMPKWIAPSGVDTPFQSSLGFNRVTMLTPSGLAAAATATVFNTWGANVTNAASTYTNPALATTNLFTSVRRGRLTSTTTAGALASSYSTSLMAWRGNAAGLGGFFFTIRFGTSTLASGNRMFVGLTDSTSAPTNIDPTTNTTPGMLGLAINANSGNWNWVNNITGTAPTVTGLGASFPVNTTSLYELVIYSPPNGSSITYRVTNLSTAAVTSDTVVSTNIPGTTTFLAPRFWATNNATGAAVAIDSTGWYLESDD